MAENRLHRRSIRLPDFDYTQAGAYYITVCTYNRGCIFGEILRGEMFLNDMGRIVVDEWEQTMNKRANVELDEFIMMPNHLHGIVIITQPFQQRDDIGVGIRRGVLQYAPTTPKYAPNPPNKLQSPSQTIGAIVRGFKSATTKRINELRQSPRQPVWQRNYYEHVVRNEADLDRIRTYILNNPANWKEDSERDFGAVKQGVFG